MLIGCGLSRFKIITTKYVIFWLVSSVIISIHAAVTMAIPIFLNKVSIHMENIQTIMLYYLIYTSIISVVFFLSIISKTLIKSIMFNLAFIILSSIAVSALDSSNYVPIIPLQSLQFISNTQGDKYTAIISTVLYILSTYTASCLVFLKQEL
ncbi:ABC-2 family transporter protein [compost metagenome]